MKNTGFTVLFRHSQRC